MNTALALSEAHAAVQMAQVAETDAFRGIARAVLHLDKTAWDHLPPSVQQAVTAYDDACATAREARTALAQLKANTEIRF